MQLSFSELDMTAERVKLRGSCSVLDKLSLIRLLEIKVQESHYELDR